MVISKQFPVMWWQWSISFAEKPSVSMALAFCLWSRGYENLPTTKECCPSQSLEFF
jgi:hypothetical protein